MALALSRSYCFSFLASKPLKKWHFPYRPRQTYLTPAVRQTRLRCSEVRAQSTSSQQSGTMPGTSDALDNFFAGAMPKEEIGALRFLKDNPNFDGRGVVVAIFDTGVDPGTSGLQLTSDGKPKILDVLDGSGSGDVDTSKVVELDEDGCLTGLTGRKLKVNPDWKNPSGKWHIGSKELFQLLSKNLKTRLETHQLKTFKEKQRVSVAEATAALAKFDSENPSIPSDDENKKKERGELESRVKLLQSMMEKHNYVGPILDCVVWHDGDKWRAALDTSDMYEPGSGEGALADFDPLTNYKDERKYATFSAVDALNFACNIYEEGKILSIVAVTHMHGTHVAGIVGANHPESPELNGVAPGCQIVSCKIGDTRLGSIETGPGLTRAVAAALSHKVDMCNMSYGEDSASPNSGRFVDLLRDLVYKHNIIFVTSAGNNGPGISTLGAPGMSEPPITIGAYVTPALAAAGHSLKKNIDEVQQYTFTSRGPSFDGYVGVDACAPGGAIAPVPQCEQQSRYMANGTSMASPSACGGIALLVSAMKANGQQVSVNRIKRAVTNTCLVIESSDFPQELSHGGGLLQVDNAWEYLLKTEQVDVPDVRYDVKVRRTDGGPLMRGIYIWEKLDTDRAMTWRATVNPLLHEDADVKDEKLAIENRISLKSTKPWIKCPEGLLLTYNGRSFEVDVDPSELSEGVHYGEVVGTDMEAPWRGPLFRVPITVVVPMALSATANGPASHVDLGNFKFSPGKEVRKYISVPPGASWAEFTMKSREHVGSRIFTVDTKQMVVGTRVDAHNWSGGFQFESNSVKNWNMKVLGGKTLEVSFAQYWSSFGDCEIELEVAFHGLDVSPGRKLYLNGSAGVSEFMVTAPIRMEPVKPSAELTHVLTSLSPADAVVEPFSDPRDTLPDSRILSKLMLSYKLSVTEAGKFTPALPMFNRLVYDGEVEGQMVMVYDENKKCVGTSDIYPKTMDLKKGDYTIKVLLRHESSDFLDKLRSQVLVLARKLDKPLSLPVYSSRNDCAAGRPQFKGRTLYIGESVNMVLANPSEELPKDCTPGTIMSGSMSLGTLSTGKGSSPDKVTLTYAVPPAKASTKNGNDNSEEPKSTKEKIDVAVRDAKIKVLESLKLVEEEEDYKSLLAELKNQFPGHIPLLSAALKKLDSLTDDARTSRLPDIVKAADDVISAIDQTELAVYLARKTPEEGKEASLRAKELDKQQSAIVDALKAKATALLDMEKDNQEDVEEVFTELGKWVKVSDAPHVLLHAKHEAFAGRYAEAIKSLDSALAADDRTRSLDKKLWKLRSEYFGKLGWEHWEKQSLSAVNATFPPDFLPF